MSWRPTNWPRATSSDPLAAWATLRHRLRYSAHMTVLALKLLLAPLLVVASSLAGRRWGPQVAGVTVVLPVVAGPILLILYLDHGASRPTPPAPPPWA